MTIVISAKIYHDANKHKSVAKEPSNIIRSMLIGDGIVTNIWIEESKLDILKSHGIRYLFVDVGDTGRDGLLLTPENEITDFLAMIKAYEAGNGYDFVLLPYSEINTEVYSVTGKFMENFVTDYIHLNELGFDGVYVDIEPVKFEMRNDYLNLLKNLKARLPSAILGVYSGSLEESENEYEWNYSFFNDVSGIVDFIVIPGYDTQLTGEIDYEDYIITQTKRIASQNWNSYFFMGVPTHKDYPETLINAMQSYSDELGNYPDNQFLGVSIFSEWTITSAGWEAFERYK